MVMVYRLPPFLRVVQAMRNNKSAFKLPKFVEDAIFKLLEDGCMQEVSSPPRCINPFSLAKGKKLRLLLDLRYVNQHLHCPIYTVE